MQPSDIEVPPPTKEQDEDPKEVSLIRALCSEFIQDLDPHSLRELAGNLIQTPERVEMLQLAENQMEIAKLREDFQTYVKNQDVVYQELNRKFDKLIKYGGVIIAAVLSTDLAFKLLELMM